MSSVSQLHQNHSITQLLTALLSSLLASHFNSLLPPLQGGSSDDSGAVEILLNLIDEMELEEQGAFQLVK